MHKNALSPEGIDISVRTKYLQEQSDPDQDRYVFAYTIDIENKGSKPVKLVSRHWIITDDNDKVEEVKGSGVVGKQPMIQPGQAFQYTSGAILETGFGTMQGSYEMLTEDGEKFAAVIPPFLLSRPLSVH
ncbi:MAG: Co2+/Mg2+ efflux protein ApaG [Pseudohongiellaceae bacterium]|nr:Co2+/Mg2+ efflux protein ApaG [Pseudohongiellaceae bacterium]